MDSVLCCFWLWPLVCGLWRFTYSPTCIKEVTDKAIHLETWLFSPSMTNSFSRGLATFEGKKNTIFLPEFYFMQQSMGCWSITIQKRGCCTPHPPSPPCKSIDTCWLVYLHIWIWICENKALQQVFLSTCLRVCYTWEGAASSPADIQRSPEPEGLPPACTGRHQQQ